MAHQATVNPKQDRHLCAWLKHAFCSGSTRTCNSSAGLSGHLLGESWDPCLRSKDALSLQLKSLPGRPLCNDWALSAAVAVLQESQLFTREDGAHYGWQSTSTQNSLRRRLAQLLGFGLQRHQAAKDLSAFSGYPDTAAGA